MRFLILALVLSACAPKAVTPDAPKLSAIQKSWVSHSPWWTVDLSSLAPQGDSVIVWTLAYGQTCESAVQNNSGALTMALSTQLSAVQGSDVPCSMFDGSWTYSISGEELTMCQSGAPCVVFK